MDRMQSIQSRVESWIKDQRDKVLKVSWGPLQWKMRWPFWNSNYREQRKKIQQEYERRRQQLHDLCLALKAESVVDLQEILCCMVLSECVYKEEILKQERCCKDVCNLFNGWKMTYPHLPLQNKLSNNVDIYLHVLNSRM